jgi:transketolase
MIWNISNINQIASEVLEEDDLSVKSALMQRLAQGFRLTVFDLLHRAGSGHWGGSSSAAELLTVLYFHILNIDTENPRKESRDRFILSKGHGAPMLYTVLSARGFFPLEDLSTLRELNSHLQGHPCMKKTPGVDMSTGALGHGLSVAVGMALSAPLIRQEFRTIVLIGDGDLNEGQTWEGIMSASKFKPEGLIILVDYNRVQLDGSESEIMPTFPLIEKFASFGINVCPGHHDGHDVGSVLDAWDWIGRQTKWPVAVVFDTIKGKGISFTENNHRWHGARVDDLAYEKGYLELDTRFQELDKKC